MTDKDFNKRCLDNYSQYTCKDCNHYKDSSCKQFPAIEVKEDFTCKSWELKD